MRMLVAACVLGLVSGAANADTGPDGYNHGDRSAQQGYRTQGNEVQTFRSIPGPRGYIQNCTTFYSGGQAFQRCN